MMGSAAFLLPDGRMEPERVYPPSTMYCRALMRRCVVELEGEAERLPLVWLVAPRVRSLGMTIVRGKRDARCAGFTRSVRFALP